MVVALVGFFPLVIFLIIKFELMKSWWITPMVPGVTSHQVVYGALPLGTFFFSLARISQLPNYNPREWQWYDMILILIPLSFGFMIWPPKWVQPPWLLWLQREYGYCLHILQQEGRQMGRWEWGAQVATHEGLQTWVNEVYQKRQEEIDELWCEVKFLHLLQQEGMYPKALSNNMPIPGYIPEHRRDSATLTQADVIRCGQYFQVKKLK